MCIFAKWNVEGVMAGFSPKDAYRKAHGEDVTASPLMHQLQKPTPLDAGLPANQVLPDVQLPFFPVPSYNSIQRSLEKVGRVRKLFG